MRRMRAENCCKAQEVNTNKELAVLVSQSVGGKQMQVT
jgi:hypothetical protein